MDPYANLARGRDDEADASGFSAWVPADDEFLPGRVGRVGYLAAVSVDLLPPPPPPPVDTVVVPEIEPEPELDRDLEPDLADFAIDFGQAETEGEELVAGPLHELLMMPVPPAEAPVPAAERTFWRRRLAPLRDFSDVSDFSELSD
jgi:hypothetical protein